MGQEDPMEKEMIMHSSILAWEIAWREKTSGLQSMWSQRVGHDLETKQQQQEHSQLRYYKIHTHAISYLIFSNNHPKIYQLKKYAFMISQSL